MKFSKITIISLFSVMLTACGMAYAETPENLLTNPGFEVEDATGWPTGWWTWSDRQHFSLDTDTAHSGSKSLKITVTDPGAYVLLGQTVPVTPGESYNIGTWIRTDSVTSPGAHICIEWYRNGTWLGGEWSAGTVAGTQNWQFTGVVGVRIPEEATSANVYLYFIQGSTGTAWFDDVIVEKQAKSLMQTFILRPNYRGKILPGAPSPEIKVEITLNLEEHVLSLDEVGVVGFLEDQAGHLLVQERLESIISNPFSLDIDIPNKILRRLRGVYNLRIVLYELATENTLAENTFSIEKLSWEALRNLTSYIDGYNRFVLNGKPFFPIGLYVVQSLTDTSQLDEIANSPFDTLMNYNINNGTDAEIAYYLNQLKSRNLKLIFSLMEYIGHGQEDIDIITHKVNTFKDHPAVISWYMNDECGLEYLPELEARYQKVTELDENHPVWSVNWRKYVLIEEAHTTDILGVDPYPIPNNPITLVSEMADWAKEAGRGYRPLWLVPQIFDWSDYGLEGRPPTREEMRAMTYLAINHGAKGLIYYSYFNVLDDEDYETRWQEIKEIASEVDYLKPVLLSTQKANDNDIICDNTNIDFKLMREYRTYYLFAINTKEETMTDISFQSKLLRKRGVVGILFEDGRQMLADNGNFTDDFGPYEVHVYYWK